MYTQNEETVFEQLKEILINDVGVDYKNIGHNGEPSSYTSFDEYLDSLDKVEFVMAVEEHFEIAITDREAESIRCMKDAVEYLYPKVAYTMEQYSSEPIPVVTARQDEVVKVLLDERRYQESKWREFELGEFNKPNDWLVYIQRYLNKSVMDENNSGDMNTMDNIRKIGAMCMAAMEQNQIVERDNG